MAGDKPGTASAAGNGVVRCTSCGASETHADGHWLVCAYCRHRWIPQTDDAPWLKGDDIAGLVGTTVHDGAAAGDAESLMSVECSGCGATVGINTAVELSAQCHWCRHTLSLSNPVGNGAVPDAILPFYVSREDAQVRMWHYVNAKSEFCPPAFNQDFARYQIYPVYLPYFVVDGNVTVRLDGEGQRVVRVVRHEKSTTYYSDLYRVMREADLAVDDLAIEARSTRTKMYEAVSTSNIINAIQPFDVKNAVAFDARYIGKGVSFEPRDTQVDQAMSTAAAHYATMTRGYVEQTLGFYGAGVRWDAEQVAIKGTRWVSMLLPVWLYGYEEQTPTGPMMHYIAVNGRTGEVQGSVPVDHERAKKAGWKLGLSIGAIGVGLAVLDLLILATGAVS